jgi:glycosyltransferase involved in cell wall biosynthesis
VPAGDEAALAEQLRWVLGHPQETRAMGRCARVFAERFFSTEAYEQGYRQMFAEAQALLTRGDEHADTPL